MFEANEKYEMMCFRWGSCERNGPVETRPHPRGKKKMSEEYEKKFSVIKVSRIDLQEGELYAQHYDQRKELGRCW